MLSIKLRVAVTALLLTSVAWSAASIGNEVTPTKLPRQPITKTLQGVVVTAPNDAEAAGVNVGRGTIRVPRKAFSSNNSKTTTKQKDRSGCHNKVSGPVQINSGSKVETYSDFAMPGEMGLKYERYYTYAGWTNSLDFRLDLACAEKDNCLRVTLYRPDGSSIDFQGNPLSHYGDFPEVGGDGLATLVHNTDGTFVLHDEDATTQVYDDGYGYLQSIKDASGIGWTLSRSSYTVNYTLTVTHTNGQKLTIVQALQPDGFSIRRTLTDPAGNVYVYMAGSSGPYGLTSVTLPGSPATVIGYKYGGGQLTEVDYNGAPYELTTYLNGRVSTNRMADGTQQTSILYGVDANGAETATVTNPLGHQSTNVYAGVDPNSSLGLLTSSSDDAVADCGSTVNTRAYDVNGNLAKTVDNNGIIHTYNYAANGQLQAETEAYGTSLARTTDYVWDPDVQLNRLLTITIEGWSKTAYTYNAQNRLASVAVTNLSANGVSGQTLTTTYLYTLYANGMVHTLSVTHPSPNNGNTDVSTYDSLGNLISATNGLGQTATYGNYNGLDEVGHVVGPNGDATDYTYDARGRVLTKTTHPNGVATTWNYAYDGFGLLYTLTAPDGEVTTWNRNAVMQVTSVTHDDKDGISTEHFDYDANGDVDSHDVVRGGDTGFAETIRYDALGRVYQRLGMHGQVLTYGYDGNGNVLSVTNAAGHVTSYQYDALNRATKVVESGGASAPLPGVPTLSTPAASSTGGYTLSWTAVSGSTSYVLQELMSGGSWSVVTSGAARSWNVSGQVDGSYSYRVQACNATGCGAWSNVGITTVTHPPASAPVLSAPVKSTTGSFTLSWTTVSGASSYTLQEQVNGGSWVTVQVAAATGWGTTGRASGNYGYRVQACNVGGCGPWSSVGIVTVALPPGSAPVLSVPSNSSTGSYTVSWTGVTSASTYTLQEQVNGGGWATVQSIAATSWATSGKASGNYGYKVQACNANGCGPWSGVGTIAVLLPPSPPTGVAAPSYVQGTVYYITWGTVATATSYNVRRINLSTGVSSIVATTSATSATMPAPGGMQFLQYAVQACNASGCSAFASAPNTTQTDPPGPIR